MKKFTVKINTQNEQHTKISVFNRGGYSGQLTVLTEDATELIERIANTLNVGAGYNLVSRKLSELYSVHSERDPDMGVVLDALEELMKAYDDWLD